MTIPVTRQLVIEWYAWNADIERAREEYRQHPTAACTYSGCLELGNPVQCAQHRAELDAKIAARNLEGE